MKVEIIELNGHFDQKKWGNIGLIFSFFGIMVGLIGFSVYSSKYSISVILVSIAALFASVGMRSRNDYPSLQLAAGLSIITAVFLTAIFIKSTYLVILGCVILILFTMDFYKTQFKSGKTLNIYQKD